MKCITYSNIFDCVYYFCMTYRVQLVSDNIANSYFTTVGHLCVQIKTSGSLDGYNSDNYELKRNSVKTENLICIKIGS